MATTLEVLAENVRRLRVERGWSQDELANRSDCSRNHAASIETHRKAPSFDLVDKIAKAFQLPSWRLFVDASAKPSESDVEGVFGPVLFARIKKGIEAALSDSGQK